MKLTQIDILKYKSIKQSVSIVFNKGKIIALIGKNGSGKTNILEAIKYALTKNYYYGNEKIECKIQYHIELTDDEINDYFSCVQADEKSKRIIVDFDSNNPEKRYLHSSAIWIEAEEFKTKLEKVLSDFKCAAKRYLSALKKIESYDSFFGSYLDIEVIEQDHGSVVRLMQSAIDNYERNIVQQTNEIKKYLSEIFDGEKISLSRYERATFGYRIWHIPFYKIPENEQIKISPIVASSLQISKKDLEKANARLNKKLQEINTALELEYRGMETSLEEFDKIKKEISKIFDSKSDQFYDEQERINKQFESIMQQLKNIIYCNCYFLDNENSLLFYNSRNREYRNEQIKEQYLNSRNPIIEAFDIFIHERGVLDSDISFTQKDKISEQKIKKIVNLLNNEYLPNIIPKFDCDEIIKFSVNYDSNGILNMYVHEKNGDIVSFNNTSLGRRWYLTYQFVRALLKQGDMLFIDEPAAFLHPQAQVEFRNELKELSKKGVYLFYSTHSPYMIPEDWGQVYNVTMTESGTQIHKFDSGDDLCAVIREELGVTNAANILFNLEKTILLVEGVSDMACVEKFAEVLNYDISAYKILPCNGSPIFDVTYLCIQQGIKFKALFDLDNKSKPENWLNRQYGYNEYLKIFDTNDNCVFTPPIRRGKSLEDCFHENDNVRYFFDFIWEDKRGVEHVERKIDKEKIESAVEFEAETKKNFEQLFIKLGIPKLDEENN
ncbi:MAG: AAA family ATPase [Clostridiales bacterium]|nr:AAA family ATPase [Clostridiales bacterium]